MGRCMNMPAPLALGHSHAAYCSCRAAFNGDVLRIRQLLSVMTQDQQQQLDPHGHNVRLSAHANRLPCPCTVVYHGRIKTNSLACSGSSVCMCDCWSW